MTSNVELLPSQVTSKKYFRYVLGLRIENYLKDKGSNVSMPDYPYDLKLLYMIAVNDTNDIYEQLGSNQQLSIEECKDDLDMIDREIRIYFEERGYYSNIVLCAQVLNTVLSKKKCIIYQKKDLNYSNGEWISKHVETK